jgi:SAM-dependent methyltransferase
METEVNFEEYITRMEEITDKVTLLDYIDPVSTVLDYGCGSGHLAESFTPEKYTGFDIAPSMVKRAETDHPLYTFTSELPTDQKFDVVIFRHSFTKFTVTMGVCFRRWSRFFNLLNSSYSWWKYSNQRRHPAFTFYKCSQIAS